MVPMTSSVGDLYHWNQQGISLSWLNYCMCMVFIVPQKATSLIPKHQTLMYCRPHLEVMDTRRHPSSVHRHYWTEPRIFLTLTDYVINPRDWKCRGR
jgi:hypothetical protein